MNSTAVDPEWDVWQASGCAIRIDYSRVIMEELRLATFDGLNRMGYGGVEIGGVLFGVRDSDAVKILAHRPLACEYAFGPTFTLWDNDRRALAKLLTLPKTDNNLAGMQPVGWYHSHTRSEIQLSEKDLQLFQQYFPEIWQIALVLRPYRFEPVRAGFFFREPNGAVQAASSRLEFIVKPVGGKPDMGLPIDRALTETTPTPSKLAVPEPVTLEPVTLEPLTLEPLTLEPLTLEPLTLEPLTLEPGPRDSAPCPPPAISRNPRSEREPKIAPAAISGNPQRSAFTQPRRRWAWISPVSATVTAAAIAVLWAGVLFLIGGSSASAGLSLRAVDVGGQLRIDWNRNSRVIRQSQSGALEIEDGSLKVRDELSQEHLRAGSITYLRTTGNVVVCLLVRAVYQSTRTEISRFLGPPPATAATVATAAPVDAGSPDALAKDPPVKDPPVKDPSSKEDLTDAAPAERDREPEAQHVEPVEQASNQTPPQVRVKSESASQTPAPAPPVRRRLVLPPAGVQRSPEPLLPAPPVIAANPALALAAFPPDPDRTGILRLPAAIVLSSADQEVQPGTGEWSGRPKDTLPEVCPAGPSACMSFHLN
jgi:proteasome lid subunit RPN8/RPN11